MRLGRLNPREWPLTHRQRRLGQAVLVGLVVAAVVSLAHWAGLFTSLQLGVADYLYETDGDPGDEIVIVAIDEPSLEALGSWPWPFQHYTRLFERLRGASAVGLDVLLPVPGPAGDPDTAALLEAVRASDNTIMPLAPLELFEPESPGELYAAGQTVRPFSALLEAAAGTGIVKVVLDNDGTIRRVPLMVAEPAGGQVWESFGLQILRRHFDLEGYPAAFEGARLVVGDETEVAYEVPAGSHGAMLVNFVGRPNTFPTYSFADVIQDRVPSDLFDDRVVLVGMMNTLDEMDLHRVPVSARRMAGVEVQANVVHTLLNHRALVPQSQTGVIVTVVVLAVVSAVGLSRLGAFTGALFTLLLAGGYFLWTSIQFNAGHLPDVLFPFATIFLNYAAVTTARFASVRAERSRVTDIFGRFVSADVRDSIVEMALRDPTLVRPGGQQMEVSVLFADIRGFTSMSETLSPPEVVEILNLYLDSMEAQVFEHGGTLDKYTGDGMMVLFGAPLYHPDHARRAVKAALAMQQAATEVSRRRKEVEWEVVYGIGITTGPAVVGHVGSQRRLDYTAIGDTVNLAARLEGVAPPGAIYIDQATYEAVQDAVLAEALEPVKVKGKAQPVPVYSVLTLRQGAAE
jgi:adenylate cyclase